MPIPGADKFTYIGYTQADPLQLPTLYFAEGRYTQEHNNDANVGWHPVRAHHRGANINKTDYDRYRTLDKLPKATFKSEFLQGKYDSNDPTAKLFECSSDDGVTWIGHRSRSRLIKVGDKDFNHAYDEKYAKAVLDAGEVAKNSL